MSDESRERNQESLAQFLGGLLVFLGGVTLILGAVILVSWL